MTRRTAERLLWALTALVAIAGRARWASALPTPAAAAVPVIPAVAPPAASQLALRMRQADSAAARDPFRLDRSPAPTAPQPLLAGGMPPPPSFRPPLAVSGLVGPPWAAVLEGVPGQENGVLVRGGERFGELRVLSVSPAAVLVSAPDTTWRLTVRRFP
jgi:hypothetical protein